jgi:1,2-diacylglycerol 3-beta-glucosyltransferase
MLFLLDLGFSLVAIPVLVASGYLLLLSLLSIKKGAPPYPTPRLRFDFVVPSHNEEVGIAQTVKNLNAVDYPKELFRVVVVADNCSDGTAARAAEAGATVLVRQHETLKGKGYALAYAFEKSLAEGKADAVVVVDADTVVSANLLQAFAARLEAGAMAAQAHYGVQNPEASWRTRLMKIALAMFHMVRSLGRERMGVSCGLRGNGMCFSAKLIREIPHDAFSIVEDLEYGIRLGKAGYRVFYAEEAEVLGEMVSGEQASRSQRKRWEGGRLQIMRQHGLPLLRDALMKGSGLLLDLAMDVLVPPLSWLGLAAVGGTAITSLLWFLTGWPFGSLGLFLASDLCIAAYVLRGWWLSGAGARGLIDLAFAPFYVVWKVGLMFRRGARKGEWVRTAREGETR